ncbi:RICIN domain-containing protein [Streptomyces sp. FXJ1.172]|jgi:hypothetical protein|uniref:RICIN domain-containing protein n=1 Tax=Streptomyces sp. FXJ1.172 TaxID=710705 RepID=UPI0007CFF08C|nr:RICIN domain-containing protein [Streptomyces sp. FXJ1.172]WEO93434.1 RICIN domain-containing protein [Streptomyces sp. FXJ1.172]
MRHRSLLRAALAPIAAAVMLIPASPAHADGKVTWKSDQNGYYLEIYHSSTDAGAPAGQWPWNGSNTQYWYDQKLSNNYYVEYNYNSWLPLTAYNDCSQGVTQWPLGSGNTAYTTQQWKELNTGSGNWMLINHAGCSGDPYQDMLYPSWQYYNVYLAKESDGSVDPIWH